jgi:hypothetical protein
VAYLDSSSISRDCSAHLCPEIIAFVAHLQGGLLGWVQLAPHVAHLLLNKLVGL